MQRIYHQKQQTYQYLACHHEDTHFYQLQSLSVFQSTETPWNSLHRHSMAIICICTDYVWTDKHILINITNSSISSIYTSARYGSLRHNKTKIKQTRSTALDTGQPGWETFTIHTPISYQPLITNSSIHFDLCRLISAANVALLGFSDRIPGVTCPYPQRPSMFS